MASYMYASEKFDAARRLLMLPPPGRETECIAHAFHECSLGLDHVNVESIDDNTRQNITIVKEAMDTAGLIDPEDRGLFTVKAQSMTDDDKQRFADAVDALASWFDHEFWIS